MEELPVRTAEGSYPIWLGPGIARHAGALLEGLTRSKRCAVVTNPTVALFHAEMLLAALRAGGFEPVCITVPDGEEYKNLDTLSKLYDEFVGARLERESLVVALGGGVVGDMTGLAAATFMRGLPFVQVPTTLLAMVDASVGGKVAVDHPAGKNLIGAFKVPLAVLADPSLLETLPEVEYRSGLAEVIKHGIVGDPVLFSALEAGPLNTELLARALRVKIALVEQDPFERNVRAHLNLGHTFGHAIETLTHYQVSHGFAVAMGTACATRLAVRRGYCDAATHDRILALFERWELPTRIPPGVSAQAILDAMWHDKKVSAGRLRLVLPRAVGEVMIVDDVQEGEIMRVLEE